MEPSTTPSHKNSSRVIIILLSVALLAALGWIIWQNFIDTKGPTTPANETAASDKTSDTPKEGSVISEVANTDMMRYTNHDLGFQFDFPRQTHGNTGCHVLDVWYNGSGTITPPVTSYGASVGAVDMTVLEGQNIFTITQKRAPLLTNATYEGDGRSYFDSCKMVNVSQSLINSQYSDTSLLTEHRSWQVYQLASESEISKIAEEELGMALFSPVRYTLGELKDGRQAVSLDSDVVIKNPGGGGASKIWYFPSKKLFVYIGLGQALSFAKVNDTNSYYIDQIVDSFKLLN